MDDHPGMDLAMWGRDGFGFLSDCGVASDLGTPIAPILEPRR
jgi:hypothetical protein